ncbi:MAG: hypothetical protein WC600_16890 [Desulfobaccales bacterium]
MVEVYIWDNAKGGMRFAFPPYGLHQSTQEELQGYLSRLYIIAKSFFLLTPHPTLSHKGRGELEEKTFGKRYI